MTAVPITPSSRLPAPARPPGTDRTPVWIAVLSLAGIALHLFLRFSRWSAIHWQGFALPDLPLLVVLALGGIPLIYSLLVRLVQGKFGSDLLAGISIVTAALLSQYLAGALVVLMLSGGEALESYATRSASAVLQALAKRMPMEALRQEGEKLVTVPVGDVQIGDTLVVLPHSLCPVDGTVIAGHGSMDESYLTGEPYRVTKAPGTSVLSGAINEEAALTIRCEKRADDSRYARIMQVMQDAEQRKPHLRRLGDQLGAWYTPLAVTIALAAGITSGDPMRFLAVLVIATPCPLLIAIPVAIVGSISLAARQGIVIRDPAVLEKISTCRTFLLDKTGTLTYGRPKLVEILPGERFSATEILALVASLERYSRHPLSEPIRQAAAEENLALQDAAEVQERPGAGLQATIAGRRVYVTSRSKAIKQHPNLVETFPPPDAGMECIVLVDGAFAAVFRFRDEPRRESASFIRHLLPQHRIERVLLVSGDRAAEVAYLAAQVDIKEVFHGQSPEEKLALVRQETQKTPTLFLGDGINDAPALSAATVGVALGHTNEITGEAAGAVILDGSLGKVDTLLHIGLRMRTIALQSAVGGMTLSLLGMLLAATGHLSPVAGAVTQEGIDVLAVLNALRAAIPPKVLSDY